MSITIGQTIQVKPGTLDEDTGVPLAGWSGRVIALYPEYDTLDIEWDSLTLLHLPDHYIRHSLDEGYDYLQYIIEQVNVEVINPKDTLEQVQEIREELEARYYDYELYGDPSLPFSEVERESFTADLLLPQSFSGWYEYLEKQLKFPFRAKVVEDRRSIGKELNILALSDILDPYGIIAVAKWMEGGAGEVLLCDLEATDEQSVNYQTLRKYVIWFANQ